MRSFKLLTHVALAATLALPFASPAAAQSGDPLKIGLFAPLTGNVAANGTRFRDGVQLAVEQANAAGGVSGRKLELLVEDDRNLPKEAATIGQKYASTPGVVLAIGTFSTTASVAAAPALSEAHIPQISPSSSHPDYTKASEYTFRNVYRMDQVAKVHADIILKELKAKTVVIPYFQDDWGQFVAKTTKEAVEQAGGKVLLLEPVAPNARDFRPLVSKIKSLNPDAVFLAVHYQEGGVLTQQLRQAGLKTPIGSPDTLSNPRYLELAGESAEGLILYTEFFAGDPKNKAFVDAYTAKFGSAPDQWSARAYDAANVGIAAIRRVAESGKPVTPQAVRDSLLNGSAYQGVTGETKYDAQREINKIPTLLQVRNGKYELYKPN